MKILLVLLDGLGDRSYKELGNRTPLQAAYTPNLDRMAALGSNGLFHASRPGQCLPSETAHYLMFGYDLKNFPGRGLLEASGDSVPFDDKDVLCLSHLSGITWRDEVPILTHKRDDIKGSFEEIGQLFKAISPYESNGIKFQLFQIRRNDAILVMSGDVSPYVSDSDPIIPGNPMALIKPLSENPEPGKAEQTAKAMNDYLAYCCNILREHKLGRISRTGFLATQRCGRRIIQEPFRNKWGLNGMLIASESVYIGLANELGLNALRVTNSDDPGMDLRERIKVALEDKTYDFIHVHTKAPDESAHKGDPSGKQETIKLLDKGLDELLDAVTQSDDLLVAVTADHSTPSRSTLIHSGEPVPLTLVGPNVRRDRVKAFDEIIAGEGCLGSIRGNELMLMLLNYTDRSALLGHQLGSFPKFYFPDSYEPFKV